ncbi:hypothetical protein [Kitasatospora aureofaciens]|nr:hypothetical protein [Kitasatospora aureofaciens]
MTDDQGNLLVAATVAGDVRRLRLRLAAGSRHRLTCPAPDIGH